MKTRINLLILMLLFAGRSVMGQEEARQVSLKMYLPIQFNAGNYQGGTYTWGRWYVPGIELGLNLKKKRFEQEFILGSPRVDRSTYYYDFSYDSGSVDLNFKDMIQTRLSLSYQVGYAIQSSRSKNLSLIPGLGLALESNFAKMVDYDGGFGVIDYKSQTVVFRPYLFTALRYSLNKKWGIEGSIMYSPLGGIYSRFNIIDNPDPVSHHWNSGNYGKSLIYSRFGVSYTF